LILLEVSNTSQAMRSKIDKKRNLSIPKFMSHFFREDIVTPKQNSIKKYK